MATCCNCGISFQATRDKSSRCRACKSAYNREHYLKNTAVYIARAARRKALVIAANMKRLVEFLSMHPCVDCGEADPIVLEFDHIRDKYRDVALMLANGHSWAAICREIEKCEVRCANCHRRVTAARANWRRTRVVPGGLLAVQEPVRVTNIPASLGPLFGTNEP